jgi:hypothetical protein
MVIIEARLRAAASRCNPHQLASPLTKGVTMRRLKDGKGLSCAAEIGFWYEPSNQTIHLTFTEMRHGHVAISNNPLKPYGHPKLFERLAAALEKLGAPGPNAPAQSTEKSFKITWFHQIDKELGICAEAGTIQEMRELIPLGPPGWKRYLIEKNGEFVERGDPFGQRGLSKASDMLAVNS